jgi:rod shape-determining protein RodA
MVAARARDFLRQSDWLLLSSVCLIVGFGLVVLYSISAGRASPSLFTKQVAVAILGTAMALGVSAVDYRFWRAASWGLYALTVALLLAVLVVGQTVHATRGWLGTESWRFQPVELAKLTLVLTLAAYFARRSRAGVSSVSTLLQSLALVAVPLGLVLLQPDLGSAAILLFLWLGVIAVVGVKRRYLIALVLGLAAAFLVAWFALFEPYQRARLTTFLVPAARTTAQSYNVRQATIAIGAGQIFGRGLGEGSQSQLRFLPEASTDFIFAVVGEELGFAGVLVIAAMFLLLVLRGTRAALNAPDDFGRNLAFGVTLLLGLQAFVNIAVVLGLLPTKGLALPFISYGGTSMVTTLLAVGILLNVSSQGQEERR